MDKTDKTFCKTTLGAIASVPGERQEVIARILTTEPDELFYWNIAISPQRDPLPRTIVFRKSLAAVASIGLRAVPAHKPSARSSIRMTATKWEKHH